MTGVWVAFYGDRSSIVPFGSEVECLRYAVAHSMEAVFVPWGMDVLDAERQARHDRTEVPS